MNNYLIALFGWFIYNFLLFNLDKDGKDDKGLHFNYNKYVSTHWDNWLFTLLLAPVLVYYMDDILTIIERYTDKKFDHLDIYYLGCGVLTELVYYGLSKLNKLRNL